MERKSYQPILVPGEVYPGIEPTRLARIGRAVINAEYVEALYGQDVANRYIRVRQRLVGEASSKELRKVPEAGLSD